MQGDDLNIICEAQAMLDTIGGSSNLEINSLMWNAVNRDQEEGETHQLPQQLSCRYSAGLLHRSPFLEIGPMRVEELHLQPAVVMIHDIVHPLEIDEISVLSQGNVSISPLLVMPNEPQL
jgi:hypothetical protein